MYRNCCRYKEMQMCKLFMLNSKTSETENGGNVDGFCVVDDDDD